MRMSVDLPAEGRELSRDEYLMNELIMMLNVSKVGKKSRKSPFS